MLLQQLLLVDCFRITHRRHEGDRRSAGIAAAQGFGGNFVQGHVDGASHPG